MQNQGNRLWARPFAAALAGHTSAIVAALLLAATPAFALEFYVDGGTGDDARSALEAQSPATPWATITHALDTVDTSGGRHTILIAPGTYVEAPGTSFADIEIKANGGAVVVQATGGNPGLDIQHGDVLVEGITFEGGTHGIRAANADGLEIRGCTAVDATFNGIHVETTAGLTIENSRAVSAGSRGIFIDHSSLAYVRNNLVYDAGEWGIDVENTNASDPQPPLSTGNVIAFNTVAYNGALGGGGLRLKNAIGDVRDNVIAENTGTGLRIDTAGANVQNILLFNNTTQLSPATYALGGGMIATDPVFVDPDGADNVRGGVANYADDSFALDPSSPAVDAGSGLVGDRDIDGSTRQDLAADTGTADLGFHSGASASTGAPAVPVGPATYHVNAATGSDARDRIEAQDVNTPWATISHALGSGLIDGETIVVAGGTYAESLATTANDTTIITTAGATLEIPFDDVGVTISHSGTTIDGFTIDGATNGAKHGVEISTADDATIQDVIIDTPTEIGVKATSSDSLVLDGVTITSPGTRGVDLTSCNAATLTDLVVTGGTHAILASSSNSLTVRGCNMSGQATDAIDITDSSVITVDTCTIDGSGDRGMLFERTDNVYARNNLVTDCNDWGIHFDSSVVSTATGNVVAFNTVVGNGAVTPSGGIRFQNATGEIRDNIVVNNANRGIKTDTAGSTVHHNDVFGSAIDYESGGGAEPIFWGNLAIDPAFVGAPDYRLTAGSPAIDAGSGDVANVDISGSATQSGVADSGTADMGFHPDASGSTGAPAPAPILPGMGPVHYVDCATGSNSHTKMQAQNPATPWLTIRFAAQQLGYGEVVEVLDGTCSAAAEIEIDVEGAVIRTENSRGTTVVAADSNAFNIQANDVTVQGFVIQTDARGVLADDPDAVADLEDIVIRDLEIVSATTPAASSHDRITVRDTVRAIVENSEIEGGVRGILLRRTQDAYVRNNRIFDSTDFCIEADDNNGDGDATGNIIAFATATNCGSTGGNGGIRFEDATGEIRDSIIANHSGIGVKTDTAPVHVHHNVVFGNPIAFDTAVGQEPALWDNLVADPLFADADQHLSEIASGQGSDSPALDMGSGAVATVDISGTTRTDATADDGTANIGFHYDASPTGGIPAVQDPPGGAGPYTYYVDTATGDDSRSKYDARDPSTPWATIGEALEAGNAAALDTVSVKAGTYAEAAESSTGMVTLVADGVVNITPGAGNIGLRIEHPGFTIEGFTVTGGLHGIRARTADGVVIRDCTISGPSSNGLMIVNTTGATLENNRVDAAGSRGILLDATDQAYVRNNGVTSSGGWGIQFDSNGEPTTSADNVVAFNTVYDSGASSAAGGIRFQNATGEIRDNVVLMNNSIAVKVDTAPAYIHHNVIHGSTTDIDTQSGQEPVTWENLTSDPLLVNPAGGDLSLSHTAAGQGSDSPAIDQGSADVSEADISGSTRTDATADSGVADPGFHEGASPSTGIPPVMTGPERPPRTYYVDPVSGNDGNSTTEAQSPGTPWQTIVHAISESIDGDTIHLQAGTYAEQVSVNRNDLTIEGVGAPGSVIITPPGGQVGISIEDRPNIHIKNLVVQGGSQAVRAENAPGLRVFGVVATGQTTNGLRVVLTTDAWIDSCIVTGAGVHGISVDRSSQVYVRNNLVYANTQWGIDFDNTTPSNPQPPLSTGNAIAFNTVHQNGDGIRVKNISGEIRDNQITNQVDLGLFLSGTLLLAHHNNFANNARDRDKDSSSAFLEVWANLGKNPRYVDPAGPDGLLGGANWEDDDFRLQTLAAGEDHDSPSIDAGSDTVANLDIGGSTATLGGADADTADVGYHYGAPEGVAIPAFATPPPQPTRTFYTSPSIGDDSRTESQAQDPATPWASLGMALQQADDGDTVIALPGVYPEAASVERDDLTLRSDTPGGAVVQPISGTAISVNASGVTVDGFVLRSAATGINVTAGSNDVRITNCAATGSSTDGIRASDVTDLTIENSVATGNTFSGIDLRRVQAATIRNNLSYANGDWGLSHDNSPVEETLSVDNLIAHNTFTMNGLGNARLLNAIGTVRDNLLTDSAGTGLRLDTAGTLIEHNGFFGNGTPIDPESYLFCAGCTENETVVPRYIDPTGADGILGGSDWSDDDFRLAQLAANPSLTQSDAIDFGSDLASTLGVNGSTATTGTIDSGAVDIGFHYDSSMTALPAPSYTLPPTDVLYVDAALGDDARTRAQANSPSTPWQTLTHALGEALPGDTIMVAGGTYEEGLKVETQDVTIHGAGRDLTIFEPGDRDGFRVRATGVTIENLGIQGGKRGIAAQGTPDDLTISDVTITDAGRDGLTLSNGDNMSVSGVIVTGSRRYGIYVRKATGLQMRDCDLYDNGRTGLGIIRSDGTISFVTVYGNRDGVRSSGNTITFRDSIVAGNDRMGFRGRRSDTIAMSHTLFGLNGRADVSPDTLGAGVGMQLDTDPEFVDAASGDLDLLLSSPAIDAGSDTAANLNVTGSATGGAIDTGVADLGAHR